MCVKESEQHVARQFILRCVFLACPILASVLGACSAQINHFTAISSAQFPGATIGGECERGRENNSKMENYLSGKTQKSLLLMILISKTTIHVSARIAQLAEKYTEFLPD